MLRKDTAFELGTRSKKNMMNVVKRALPFLLTLVVGVFLGSLFKPVVTSYKSNPVNVGLYERNYEYRYGRGCRSRRFSSQDTSLVILFKPLASYTEEARQNEFEGTVRLLVEFRADGKIGDIKVLQSQPYGLTDKAKEAARKIQFKPTVINGESVTVNKEVEFEFRLKHNF
jgi:TonB family protein